MKYGWENESLQKYGEEITAQLIDQQQQYEEKHQGNDCLYCGALNQGTIIESNNKTPIIIHFGLFSVRNGISHCDSCRKLES